jgi:hypothetical protein
MFDLNQAIDDWRTQLGRADGCLGDDVAELEEHLREEVAGLARAGLTEEEAFLLATRRLGRVDLLGEEFGKVNGPSIWLNRSCWMAAGALGYLAASVAASAASRLVLTGSLLVGLHPYVAGALVISAHLVMLVAVALWFGRTLVRRRARQAELLPGAPGSRLVFMLVALLWFTLLPASQFLVMLPISVRMISPSTFGQAVMVVSYGTLATSIVVPALLAAWIAMAPRWARSAWAL